MTVQKMRALVQTDFGKTEIKEIPVPTLEANDVLVKVAYVAQNPTDWKHAASLSPAGRINGCDFSGAVVALGPGLINTDLKVGDNVAGCVHGGFYTDKGAFAEYLRVESDLTWKVPEGFKLEDAATFGVPWVTALQALVDTQKKPFPPASENQWIFIYGGSSGVGLFALQLAKLMGYKVATTSSPHSFDLVKSFGADEVFDYHDAEAAIASVQRVTGGVTLAMDCISEGDSFKISIGTFGKQGGQLNVILPASAEVKAIREDVKIEFTLMYTLFGLDFEFGKPGAGWPFKANTHDRAFHVEVCKRTPEYISKYGFRAPPVTLRGTLDDILAGYEDMKNGKVSGGRLVYKVAA